MKNFYLLLLALLAISCHAPHEHHHDDDHDHAHDHTSNAANTERLDLSVLKNQFILNSRLFNNVLEDITEEEANTPINGHTNSIKWIAGHTLNIAYNVAKVLDLDHENPYKQSFGHGKPFDPQGNYPPLENMINDWNALSPKIESAIGSLSIQQLSESPPFEVPHSEQSIRGLVAFQMHHFGYEIGQLGLYRRYFGKTAMSYQ